MMTAGMVHVTQNFNAHMCHACHTHVHFQDTYVHPCIHVWSDCIHVQNVCALSTYGDPHPCVLLQYGT